MTCSLGFGSAESHAEAPGALRRGGSLRMPDQPAVPPAKSHASPGFEVKSCRRGLMHTLETRFSMRNLLFQATASWAGLESRHSDRGSRVAGPEIRLHRVRLFLRLHTNPRKPPANRTKPSSRRFSGYDQRFGEIAPCRNGLTTVPDRRKVNCAGIRASSSPVVTLVQRGTRFPWRPG